MLFFYVYSDLDAKLTKINEVFVKWKEELSGDYSSSAILPKFRQDTTCIFFSVFIFSFVKRTTENRKRIERIIKNNRVRKESSE